MMNGQDAKAPRRALLYAAIILASLLSGAAARAQGPDVSSLFPPGGPRGGVTAVRISGRNLQGAKVLVSAAGVKVASIAAAPNGESADVRLTVAADAALGERELRVWTPQGVSRPLSYWVDALPNSPDARIVEQPVRSQPPKTWPVVLNGDIGASGVTVMHAFDAAAGETWVVDANVARIHSALDPALELLDESGAKVAEGKVSEGGDPRIVFRCEKAGRYRAAITDRRARFGPDFVYRLTIGKLPVVTSVVPHGEKPGRKVAVRLEGANLGTTTRAVVDIPPDAVGLVWSTVRTSNGLSLPFPLIAEFAPVVGLTETDALMPLPTLPCALEGRFAVYPSLRFAFEGKPGQTFVFAMVGRTLGSDVDGAISIQETSGKVLMTSGRSTGDARLEFTPPANGVYVVEARDRTGKLGPARTYRLTASLASPDFRAVLDTDRIVLPAGESVKVKVSVERMGGFDGPVRVTAAGLPRGVTLSGGPIPAGQTEAELTFTAAPTGARTLSAIKLSAVSTAGAKSLSHAVTPRFRLPDGTWCACALLPLAIVNPPSR